MDASRLIVPSNPLAPLLADRYAEPSFRAELEAWLLAVLIFLAVFETLEVVLNTLLVALAHLLVAVLSLLVDVTALLMLVVNLLLVPTLVTAFWTAFIFLLNFFKLASAELVLSLTVAVYVLFAN